MKMSSGRRRQEINRPDQESRRDDELTYENKPQP
jgi:hypothetical protein